MNNLDSVTLRDFYSRLSDVISCKSFIDKTLLGESISDPKGKLKSASSRINIPEPFKVYVDIIKKHHPNIINNFKTVNSDDVKREDLDHFKSFSKFQPRLSDHVVPSVFLDACNLTARELGLVGLHDQCTAEESISYYTKSTSSGFPLYGRKNDLSVKRATLKFVSFLRSGRSSLYHLLKQPCTVFHRFQYKYKDNSVVTKIRQVWGVPYSIIVLEGIFFRNLFESSKEHLLSCHLPPTTLGRSLVDISDNVLRPFYYSGKQLDFVSVDIKRLDSNIPSYFTVIFFMICHKSIKFNSSSDEKMFWNLMLYEIFTPYCYNGTSLLFQYKGTVSGSLLTSMFNTFVVRAVINYSSLLRRGVGIRDSSINLGDDNIVRLCRTYDQFDLIFDFNLFSLEVGDFEYNKWNCETFKFIGYIWDKNIRPTQDLSWYAVHYCYPSRFFKLDGFESAGELHLCRAITISASLYNGMNIFYDLIGKYDPFYHKLFQDMKKGKAAVVKYVDEDQRFMSVTIPLKKILRHGWRYYTAAVSSVSSKQLNNTRSGASTEP